MKRCRTCCYPDTKPDLYFDKTGQCAACINFARRPQIDWDARLEDLMRLLDRHHGECLVPSSGGKDSTAQVLMLKELGARVTVVTATTCHLTSTGRKNIDNLARYATTIEVSPNKTVRAKLNRLGLELVGDISFPEHVAIFVTPFKVSIDIGIPLIFYGENPQDQYGGPLGSEEARQMTRRWVSEYGGFLGLRATDLIGQEGLTARDMADYIPGHYNEANGIRTVDSHQTEAHFLGQYLPWDSHQNAKRAIDAGMQYQKPSTANWWPWENLDNAQTGIHDYLMFLKYGYGRGCAQISVDVRTGRIDRQTALKWVQEHDGEFPELYMGYGIEEVLHPIGYNKQALQQLAQGFTNWANLL